MPEHPHTPPHHHEAHVHQDGTDHRKERDCPGDEALPDNPIAAALGGDLDMPVDGGDSGGHGGNQPPPPPKK